MLALAGWLAPSARTAEIQIDYQMFQDPAIERPVVKNAFADRLADLWIEALDQPEVDLQRRAGESIARGKKLGVPGLQAAIPRLRELLTNDSTHPAARSAAAKALAALAAQEAADDLAGAAARRPGDVRRLCETALAEWGYEPIRAVWLARLKAGASSHRDLILAIRGLGLGRVDAARASLQALLHDGRLAAEVRIESGRALGRISADGLVDDARKLVKEGSVIGQLCAVQLLARHESDEANRILLELAVADEPAVRAEALRLLNEIDSNLVVPLAEEAMRHPDHLVRWQGMEAYTRLASPERMAPVVRLLDDLIPDLRREVCSRLDELVQRPELEAAVWAAVRAVLEREGWRGQEQAALLAGKHRHQPAAARLIQLQSVPRADARVAAAWALRKLAVKESCPSILNRARRLTELRLGARSLDQIDEQIAHLLEALAVMEYWDAEPLWREYVPKNNSMGHLSRAAAIWALGLRYNGEREPKLAGRLIERLTDVSFPAELEYVRYACAITLGRIQATEYVPRLIDWAGADSLRTGTVAAPSGLAIRWTVSRLTGEQFPELQPRPITQGVWFLVPIEGK